MRTAFVAMLLLFNLPAFAQTKEAEAEIKPEVEAIKKRTASARELPTKLDDALRAAGFQVRVDAAGYVYYSIGKSIPSREAVQKLEPALVEIRKADEHMKACRDFREKAASLGFAMDGRSATEPVFNDCIEAGHPLIARKNAVKSLLEEWEKQVAKQDAVEAGNRAYREAVSGNDPRQRAFPLPPALVKHERDGNVIDALALFDGAHPSRFVFLRHDLERGISTGNEYMPLLKRKLKKGEAVLALSGNSLNRGEIPIVSIDGISTKVGRDDLAVQPVAGKPGKLVAEDLVVFDAEGHPIGGPAWLEPDATGFNLDDSGFLTLLDPPEPRTQKFIDARERVRACYQKQMAKLDPRGEYRRHYDVVTYGPGGVEKIESAAKNFDRKACGKCGCRKFNGMKRKLIKAAIEPAQQKAFEAYKPVLDRINTIDFKSASEGAPAGVIEAEPEFY